MSKARKEVKDGKKRGASTWTIIVVRDANEYVGGGTVTDILKQNDKAPYGLFRWRAFYSCNIYNNKNGDKVGTETPFMGEME